MEKYILSEYCLPIFQQLIYQVDQTFPEAPVSGIFYVCVLILSKISLERNFAIALNKPFMNDMKFQNLPLFVGTYADLLLNVVINGIIQSQLTKKYCFISNYLAIIVNV